MPGTHEPVIGQELWDSVQALLRQRMRPCVTGEVGLFARKATVYGLRLRALRSCKCHGRRYLRCASKECRGAFVAEDALERAVREELWRIADECLDREALAQHIVPDAALKERRAALEAELATCRNRIAAYERGMCAMEAEKVAGMLTESDCSALCRDMAAEKERLGNRAVDCITQLEKIESRQAAGGKAAPTEGFWYPKRLNREIVEAFIDIITVGRRTPGTREIPVEIHWKF